MSFPYFPTDEDRRLSPDPREIHLDRLAVGERAGTDDVSPAPAGPNARTARPALERTGRSAGVPVPEPAPRRSLRSHLELFADAVSTPSEEEK